MRASALILLSCELYLTTTIKGILANLYTGAEVYLNKALAAAEGKGLDG